jgi:SAC3/GANP family
LEQGDLNEFNQCQTMIHSLSNDATMMEHAAVEGDPQQPRVVLQQTKEAADEFAGYAILYALVRESSLELHLALQRPVLLLRAQQTNVQQQQQQQHSPLSKETKKNKNKKRQRTTTTATAESPDSNNNNNNNSSSSSPFGLYPCKEDHANKSGSSSSSSSPSSSTYQHALCVVRAVVEDDSLTFFRLYRSAPHMSAYIMDFLVKRVRQAAFERVLHAYVPVLGMEQVRQWLWFDDLEQTRRFCHQQGALFVQDDGGPLFWIDCQASCQKIKRKQQQQQQQMAGSSKSKSLSSRG